MFRFSSGGPFAKSHWNVAAQEEKDFFETLIDIESELTDAVSHFNICDLILNIVLILMSRLFGKELALTFIWYWK